jgi:hypothetical protein
MGLAGLQTHSADSIMHICKHSHDNGKTMMMNTSGV